MIFASASTMLSVATDFNNHGVKLMNNRSYENAIVMFQGALQILKKIDTEKNTPCCSRDIQGHPAFQLITDDALDCSNHNKNDPHLVQSQDLTTFSFSSPIVLETPPTITENLPKHDNIQETSCVVLFNLALATHTKALQVPPSNALINALHMASKIYEWSYEVASSEEVTVSRRPFLLVMLASLNNIGLICHELGDYDSSKTHMLDLQATVRWIQDHQDLQGDMYLSSEIVSDFLLNGMLLREPEHASAA